MNGMLPYSKLKRMMKAFGIGLLAGTVILCIFIIPAAIQKGRESAAAAIGQENLTPAQGVAFDSFAMADVTVTALLDGKPRTGISLAVDQGFWEVPKDGDIHFSLAPNNYQFIAGFENRKITFSGEVFIGQANDFVLDVGKAPSAPELREVEISQQEPVTIPLAIKNADEVTAESFPEGVSVIRKDGEFIMMIDVDKFSPNFTCIKLVAQNEYGEAYSYICLRVPSNKTVVPITSVEDFAKVREDLSGHYKLMNDIDMSEIHDWEPIGTENYPFTGIFDGQGYEITGFHAPTEITDRNCFGLFGIVQNAELRKVIFREPVLTPKVPDRELNAGFGCSVLVVSAINSLVENCGSFGGIVSPSDGSIGGLLASANTCVVRNCFNSTVVMCSLANRYLPNTGGISGGVGRSYISHCANEGEVKGNHLSGGIVGYAGAGDITHCINSGYVWGSTIVGAVPAGGIIQANDNGTIYDCYFVRGLSPRGAHSSTGFVASVQAIDMDGLRSPKKLPLIGTFTGEEPQWAYASLDAQGPVPYELFNEQVLAPVLEQTGKRIDILPVDGVRYFYTLDGSDPYTNCTESTARLSLTLKQGQTLTVFAAKQGFRDSEIKTATGG